MSSNVFYRHPKLPGLELRYGHDNRACYGLHTHSEYSLGAVLEGVSDYCYCKQHYTIRRGHSVLIAPNMPHACNLSEVSDNGMWRYLMLYISVDYWQQLAGSETVAIDGTPSDDIKLFDAIKRLHNIWQNEPNDALAIESAWVDCFQLLPQTANAFSYDDNQTSSVLTVALTWLDKHLTENFSLGEWAAATSISRVQLLRLFRQHLHISPYQYYLNRRIQQAKTLLKRGASLDDTAYELGFADQAHFQRTFKRYAAVTPLQYQRNR